MALAFLSACAAPEGIKYAKPVVPPQMRTYTPEGYEIDWWIFQEFDDSCTIEYSILTPEKEWVGHSVLPCEAMMLFFHSITPRGKDT